MSIIAVTGGNRGIGKEIVHQLAELGHTVILCSRNKDKGKAAANEMSGDIHVMQLDVSDAASAEALAAQISQQFGRLDVLVNNAGVYPSGKGASDVDINEVKQGWETNAFGPWRLSQLLLPLLKMSDDGRIVNMSSGMGEWDGLSSGHAAAYRMSKLNLNAITVMMAAENPDLKINAMCPGWVKTDMGGSGAPRSVEKGADTAVWLATENDIPSGKFFRDRNEIDW